MLLNCFAGCAAADVVAALGLEISDLFPPRRTENLSQAERAQLREYARQAQWRAALNVLAFEAAIVSIAATEVRKGHALSAEDHERVCTASARIHDVRSVLNAR